MEEFVQTYPMPNDNRKDYNLRLQRSDTHFPKYNHVTVETHKNQINAFMYS